MKTSTSTLVRALFAMALAGTLALSARAADREPRSADTEPARALAPIPATPAPVRGVLLAREFQLDVPVPFAWAKDAGAISAGTILVLEVDPAFLRPRAVAEPVLYVGSWPAWRVSHDATTGRVVVIVPGAVDLQAAPIFFGSPALPEQVDRRTAEGELALATAAGIAPATSDASRRARERGGSTLHVAGRAGLLAATQDLIERYVTR